MWEWLGVEWRALLIWWVLLVTEIASYERVDLPLSAWCSGLLGCTSSPSLSNHQKEQNKISQNAVGPVGEGTGTRWQDEVWISASLWEQGPRWPAAAAISSRTNSSITSYRECSSSVKIIHYQKSPTVLSSWSSPYVALFLLFAFEITFLCGCQGWKSGTLNAASLSCRTWPMWGVRASVSRVLWSLLGSSVIRQERC
jgi:hypothetical protein